MVRKLAFVSETRGDATSDWVFLSVTSLTSAQC
jgi:hypothetical protein